MLGKMKLFFTHGKKVLVIISKKNICSYITMYNIVFHTSEYIGRYPFISMPANSNHKKNHLYSIILNIEMDMAFEFFLFSFQNTGILFRGVFSRSSSHVSKIMKDKNKLVADKKCQMS